MTEEQAACTFRIVPMLGVLAARYFLVLQKSKLILFAFSILAAQVLYAKEGWIYLFNGKNLSGWTRKAGDAKFFVADGQVASLLQDVTLENAMKTFG